MDIEDIKEQIIENAYQFITNNYTDEKIADDGFDFYEIVVDAAANYDVDDDVLDECSKRLYNLFN